MTIDNTCVKSFLISTLFLILFCSVSTQAELPYESDNKHSFVLTSGFKKNDSFTDNFQNSYSFNYSFQDKISVGISYRDFAGRFVVYEGTGESGFLNTTEGVDGNSEQSSASERIYQYPDKATYSLYAQVKPLNLLQINAPISFSLFVAVQVVSGSNIFVGNEAIEEVAESKNFVGNVHIYKKFNLSKRHSLQPIISIGYRDISYVSNNINNLGRIGASLIYAYNLDKSISFLVAPQVYRFNKSNEFTVQVGISNGF